MSAPTSSNSHPTPADVRRVLHYLEFGEGCDCAYCRKLHIWTQAVEQEALATARAESDALRAAHVPAMESDMDIGWAALTCSCGGWSDDESWWDHISRADLAPSPAEGESR